MATASFAAWDLILENLRPFSKLCHFAPMRRVAKDWCMDVDRLLQVECETLLPEAFSSKDTPRSSVDLLRALHGAHARTRRAAHDSRFADACVSASSAPSATASGYIALCAFNFGVLRVDITSGEEWNLSTRILTQRCPMSFMNASAALLSNETLIVFGGELPLHPNSASSAVYALDVSGKQVRTDWRGPLRLRDSKTHSRLSPSRSCCPEARVSSAICVADDRVFIFGGVNEDFQPEQAKIYDDLWTLDMHDDTALWRPVQFENSPRPLARASAAMTILPIQDGCGRPAYRIFLHGGQGSDEDFALSDLWMLELVAIDSVHSDAVCVPPSLRVARAVQIHQDVGIPRMCHTLHVFGRLAVIVGGSEYDVDFFETYADCHADIDAQRSGALGAETKVKPVTCIMESSFDAQASRWQIADLDGIRPDSHYTLALNGGRSLIVGGCIAEVDGAERCNLFETTLFGDSF
eukprot:TRINITY_DN24070_c0_g1_i1.p1 TRINITY_DN24070_c0_g1~~TRINITY_DN24070_c0_g1_i1.p1  ORF type:complete len:477 (-),score=46.04 TRINITY_DN24070_c0_g1_i1:361-1758(-)